MMHWRNPLLISLALILLISGVSANAFSPFTLTDGCWTATNDTYTLKMWNATGVNTFTIPPSVSIINEVLLVGGGGAGSGWYYGGGGGAGGFRDIFNFPVTAGATINVTVGKKGVGNTGYTNTMSGNESVFANLSAAGGGAGGTNLPINGRDGGSGGGAPGSPGNPGNGNTPATTPSQGNNGGTSAFSQSGGGGGGAGSAGGASTSQILAGVGGTGKASAITGVVIFYAGGGGGGESTGTDAALGGSGIGGNGGSSTVAATDATPSTGSGGGGAGNGAEATGKGGDGSDGIIIIMYPTPISTPAQAFFSMVGNQTNVIYPSFVQFHDLSTNAPTTWNWSFGDGTWLNGTTPAIYQNPTHFYSTAGNYNVRLICNNTNTTGYGDFTISNAVTLASDVDANVTSWSHFDGTSGSSTIIDEQGVVWTANPGAALSNAQVKFGTASLGLLTNNARINSAALSPFVLGLNNATIEFWMYPTASNNAPIVKRSTGTSASTDGWGWKSNASANLYNFWYGTNSSQLVSVPANTWSHIAITFNNTATNRGAAIRVNGTLITSVLTPGSYDVAGASMQIGSQSGGTTWLGYIDEFRVSNGNNRWAFYGMPRLFTVPQVAYSGGFYNDDTNPFSTLKFKTDPSTITGAVIGNQSAAPGSLMGHRNRTIVLTNVTNAKYISFSTSYDPNSETVNGVALNNSFYSDMALVSQVVDSISGLVILNVSRNTGFNGGSTNVPLVDIDMVYSKYITPQDAANVTQYFGKGWVVNLTSSKSFPVHFFRPTNLTYLDWVFQTDLTTSNTAPPVDTTVTFYAPWFGAFPNRWNWSLDGTWVNGTTINSTTTSFSTVGPKTISVVAYRSENTSVTSTMSRIAFVVPNQPTASLIPFNQPISQGLTGKIQVNVRNISHADAIQTNWTFNKTALAIDNFFLNASAGTGVTLLAAYDNTKGIASVNMTGVDMTYLSSTDIIDVQWRALSANNFTEPLDFNNDAFYNNNVVINSSGSYANRNFSFFNNGQLRVSNDTFTKQLTFQNAYTLNQLNGIQVRATYAGAVNGSTTTAIGQFPITSPYGVATVQASADGYFNLTQDILINNNEPEYLRMVPLGAAPSQITWYIPVQVKLITVNQYGAPVEGVFVTATPLNFTAPSDWTQILIGIQPAVNISGTTLSGYTGSDGSWIAPMLQSFNYHYTFMNMSTGLSYETSFYPQASTEFRIWLPNTNPGSLMSENPSNSVYLKINKTELWFAEPNASYIRLGINYTDVSGKTQDVTWFVKRGNDSVVIYSKDLGNPGTMTVSDYQDYPNVRGRQYIWNYTATRLS